MDAVVVEVAAVNVCVCANGGGDDNDDGDGSSAGVEMGASAAGGADLVAQWHRPHVLYWLLKAVC
jgi:hypothetical protein